MRIAQAKTRSRFARIDWDDALAALDRDGHAVVPQILRADECAAIARLYEQPDAFRSRIVMARHGFGQGEYQYFAYPLPPLIADLRAAAYGPLAGLANTWKQHLGETDEYPPTLAAFTARCHAAGQRRATPLLLKYGPGDFNRLHQDLYGDIYFPIQLVVLL